ncbi:uncharacterized protein LOC133131605 [Conger conger]|uniref:uncharacterized protein LOC133131605 n=1 Tax=Conger conger TaxID=82655 RepID=UPI002A5A9789|nr:uncharacterized protein LOC133131605 [Conger conger]
MEEAINALLRSQGALQKAVAELCQKTGPGTPARGPKEVLLKQTPDDEVEAYLETFERTAHLEKWPPEAWGSILAPFLSGEAQKAYRGLPPAEAHVYPTLKATILAQYGYSLPARAQRFHQWTYDPALPARAQVMALGRLTKSWLVEGDGPALLDRVVLDRCARSLAPELKKYVAQQGPRTIDGLVNLLENHQVAQEMIRATRMDSPRRPPAAVRPEPRTRPQWKEDARTEMGRRREMRRCFSCGQEGHLSRDCPGREESMATAPESGRPCHYLTTCWAHQGTAAPRLPIRIGGQDAEALLDSGSAITLVRPTLAGESRSETIAVTCIHGDVRHYPTAEVTITTPRGQFTGKVGVVENLPVAVLLGRDCPLFRSYWDERPTPGRAAANPPPRRRGHRGPHPVWVAPSGESDGEETTTPARRRPTARPHTGTTDTAQEGPTPRPPLGPESSSTGELSEFQPETERAPTEFGAAQLQDPNLAQAWKAAAYIEGVPQDGVSRPALPYFQVQNGFLYRVCRINDEKVEQLLIPQTHTSKVLYLAHTHLLGAHLGREKTQERIMARFYWPGVKRAVEDYCRQCATCQLHSPKVTYRNPLIPLPIIDVPFRRIAMDIVGPLPKSSRGHRYILVILDYATRYPEAVPLRAATGKSVARELFLLFSRVGIAEEVLTDQGSCFMSGVMKEMCKLLHINQMRTSVYHPQTDGLVERFNKTLKMMMRKMITTDGKDWDHLLPYLMFAIREVPQASTGYAPFELLYGRRPRGLLDLAKEAWEQQPSRQRSLVEHVVDMDQRMARIWPMVREHMTQAQAEQARLYNRNAQVREFQPGDKVMVLIPTSECKFLAKWHGPYEVVAKAGPVNYTVRQVGRRHTLQRYHVNLLKKWHEPVHVSAHSCLTTGGATGPPEVTTGDQLTDRQRQDLREMTASKAGD